MSQIINMCDINEDVKTQLQRFRIKKVKETAAIIMKINMEKRELEIEEEIENASIEDLAEMIPQRQHRYIGLIFKHPKDDGRITYPLVLIFSSPAGTKMEHQMMYANTANQVMSAGGFTIQFWLADTEDLTTSWLTEQMKLLK
ncbi:hypothetical protein HZS_5121 [Henneguya salminicola]|uniref:Glia maturation factor beta (Trinotate prediction) n=1 Tax=Henneguya salminicola TaxID=69463 RepID=A0A6G3ML02_HENSL|nr:hypothetical protein HZS_5121 [Henneguya salminicola]